MRQHRVVLVKVRRDKITFIGNGCCLVGQLQRGNQYLTLTDTERADRDGLPTCLAVSPVVLLGTRYVAGRLLAEVGVAEFLPQTEGHNNLAP